MNMQTYDKETDLARGLFAINGNCGYVLKSQLLRNGTDPRSCIYRKPTLIRINVICGEYLPKTDVEDTDIVDPYVLVEIHGIPADEQRHRTKTVMNNGELLRCFVNTFCLGFNPVWNEQFELQLRCSEMAILRFIVMDFDTTSLDDFIGEFSIPVESVRAGK
jgi:phosphatidylinositol phospholipase C delta